MMKKLLTVCAAAFLLWGCVPEELMLRQPPEEDPAAPVVIAAFLPLSGENRIYAEQMREGLLCAEARLNRIHGINGRKVKVAFLDTAGSAAGTLDALKSAEKLGAVAAVAGYDTDEVGMLIAHADRLRMPMVIPLATSDYHLQVSSFVYRNCFSDLQQMEVLAAYLLHWRQKSSGGIVTDQGSGEEYTRGISRDFTQAMRDIGGSITGEITLSGGALLGDAQLRALLVPDPQFILISSGGKRAAALVRQIREAGFNGILCGPDTMDDDEFIHALAGVEPGEMIYTAFFSEENSSREFKEFRKDFRAKFFHNPGACETQSYDALIFLSVGLDKAENLLDFDKNWRTIRNHYGAAAAYTMLKKGQVDRTVYLKSLGVDRMGEKIRPYPRLSRQIQYSKLQDYKLMK